MDPKENLEHAVKNDPSIEYLIALEGDRHLIRIPIDAIAQHPTLTAIRGKDLEIELLSKSMASTGNTSVYTPCLYAEVNAGVVTYYVADGHQRVQAAKNNGMTEMVCQVITRWTSPVIAFRECVNIQAARFEMSDSDVFSILKLNVMSVAEVAKQTGRKETTLQKMKNVCEYKLLTDMIEKECITTNIASNLIAKCNKNSAKVNALLNTLEDAFEKFAKEAKHWRDKLGPNPKKKDLKEKTEVKTYFKDYDWKALENAADKEGKTKTVDGRTTLDLGTDESQASTESLVVGDTAAAWEKEIPFVMTTNEHDKLPLEHLEDFLAALPMIEKNFKVIIQRRRGVQAAKTFPMASGNPVIDVQTPPAPQKQKPDMKAG